MKQQLQTKLENYKTSISQKEVTSDLKKIGLSSAAALAAIVVAPVELTSQVVCGNMGAPTRTVGDCNGDLSWAAAFYDCAFFDFDGDGVNELQVMYYWGSGWYYSYNNKPANAYFDPIGTNVLKADLSINAGLTFPLAPTQTSYSYYSTYKNHIYYIPLSGGNGYGFITFDANHNPVGPHPVTGLAGTSYQTASPEMWGAQTGIVLADLEVQNGPVPDESNLESCEVLKPVTLPVELSRFEAVAKEKSIILSWSTETELNNSGFSIERSTNGRDFGEISFVEGAGSSSRAEDYTYEDTTPKQGVNYYYRLRQIDFDGTTDLSIVRLAGVRSTKPVFSVGPNPASGQTTINLQAVKSGEGEVHIIDKSGQVVASQIIEISDGSNSYNLDLNDLVSGIYFVRLSDGVELKYEKLIVL